MPSFDAVIVGGGIAGLATAYELSRHGTSFVVLERASRAGGVIFSEEIDGYTIDGGPDALLIQKPEGIRLCEEIGLGNRLIPTKPPRLAYIQRSGRLHALPVRVIEAGDRYADQVAGTAAGVAARAGIATYDCAFQSAGRTPEPWIGPDLAQVIDDRSVTIRKFLVVPIGFVCDHTEILFDIDVQASQIAREFSTTLRRTESLNTSPLFISTLEDLVRARL